MAKTEAAYLVAVTQAGLQAFPLEIAKAAAIESQPCLQPLLSLFQTHMESPQISQGVGFSQSQQSTCFSVFVTLSDEILFF